MHKKILFCILVSVFLISFNVFGEEPEAANVEKEYAGLFSFNLFGPLLGLYQFYTEFPAAEKMSLAISPFFQNMKYGLLGLLSNPDDTTAVNNVWLTGVEAGLNFFTGNRMLQDFYFGPVIGVAYLYVENEYGIYNGITISAGAKAGYRWILDWFAIDIYGLAIYSQPLFEVADFPAGTATTGIGFAMSGGISFAIAF